MFDLFEGGHHHSSYNNKRTVFLVSLLCSLVVLCIVITLLLKCLVLLWTRVCQCRRRRRDDSDPNKRPTAVASDAGGDADRDPESGDEQGDGSTLDLTNVVVVLDTYCQDGHHLGGGGGAAAVAAAGRSGRSRGRSAGERPYSIFQFSTDDISLAFAVHGIQPARRPDITNIVFEEIVVEALRQRRRQLNPMAKASTLHKRPSDEAIFDVQIQILDPDSLAKHALERKYAFFSNILKVQRIVEEMWEALEDRQPLWLNDEERWVCKLMLEANRGIDNTMGGHQTNPDMMCALSFIDAPTFLTQRGGPSRRGASSGGSHHTLCAHGCGGGGGSSRRSSTRSARSAYIRFIREMEQPPPKFETLMSTDNGGENVDGEEEPPPPSYDACVGAGAGVGHTGATEKTGIGAADDSSLDRDRLDGKTATGAIAIAN